MYTTDIGRAYDAAKAYLESQGVSIRTYLYHEGSEYVVAEDDGDLVLGKVAVKDGEMPAERFTQRQFESVAKRYLEESETASCIVRADTISVMLLSDGDRGLLRHHRNCLTMATEVC